ncbi:MAG: hypothetical protein V1719_02500 [Patescibacteria group bacterium]
MRQFLSFLRAVLSDLSLSFAQVQVFISDPKLVAKLKKDFKNLVTEAIKINPFVKEWVKQSGFYPRNWQAKSVTEEILKLTQLFPGINLSQVEALVSELIVSREADGIALFPKLSYLGELWRINDPFGTGYSEVLKKLLGLISGSRSLRNYLYGLASGPHHIRIQADVQTQIIWLEENTPGDVLVLPFNFGNLYAGWSARSARWEAFHNNQLPLTSAHVAVLLLLMPDRFSAISSEQLFIYCPGDEYEGLLGGPSGDWSHCPYFNFHSSPDDTLVFHANKWPGTVEGDFGSVVAFFGV